MRQTTARRLLWLGLLVFLPVPFISVQPGLVPVIRLLLLGSLAGGVALQDPDYLSRLFTLMFLGQGLAWAAVLYVAARVAAGRLPAAAPIAIVAVLAVGSLFPIYTTPFSSSGTTSSILQIID